MMKEDAGPTKKRRKNDDQTLKAEVVELRKKVQVGPKRLALN